MKRYIVLAVVISVVLIATFSFGVLTDKAFGQNQGRAGQAEQRRNIRQRWENMSPEEREKFREEMRQNRQRWENMSDEERAKLREQMRQRFSAGPPIMGRDEQLKSIKAIEVQVARLKAAVDVMAPENRSRLRELPEEERTKLREKMMTAMRERQTAIRTIEQELGKLRPPGRPAAESQDRIGELRAIHKLALKEKATQTASRLEKLISGYRRESQGRFRPPAQRPREGQQSTRRQRPVRRENTE